MARVLMVRWSFAVLAGLCALATCEVQQQCPPRGEIAPCSCSVKKNGLDVLCEFTDQQRISDAMVVLKSKPFVIFYLKLRHNNLKKLPGFVFLGLDIRHLTIHNSSLSVVEEASLSSIGKVLTQLDVSQNSLTSVPSPAFKSLHHLLILNMNHNKVNSLHSKAFQGLDTLEILTLYENKINTIDADAFVGLEKKLKRLNLGGNGLTSVPQKSLALLETLKKLEMQENRLSEIKEGDFEGLRNLDSLGLAHNKIREVPPRVFSHLTLLTSLEMDGNNIDTIDPEAFAGLEENLQYLRLGDNNIHTIPTDALKRLHRLRHLDLRSNNISFIAEDAFFGFGDSITFLNLQKNDIRTLNGMIFENLNSLETLNLQNNKLMHVPEDVMEPILDTLRVVDIMDNPLLCDCELQWYKNWLSNLKDKDDEMMQKKRTVCTMQYEHREYSLQSLPLEKMECVIKSYKSGAEGNIWSFWKDSTVVGSYILASVRRLYQENKNTVYNCRFMAYPLIFYAVLMLVSLNAKYEFLRIRLYDSNRAIIVEDPFELKSIRSHNPYKGCQITQLDQRCIVTCQNTTIKIVESGLNQLNYSVCQTSTMELVLKKIYFTNSSIRRGWLIGCTKNVTKLEIYSTELSDIGDAAFAARPFTELEYLIMDDIGINNLRKNTFVGARIAYLEFRFRRPQYLSIEAGVLSPLATSLSSFQLSNGICEPQAIKNLTGTGKNVLKLLVLDLRYNDLEVIVDETFIDVPSLVSLYLSGSAINFVETKAFSGLGRSLRTLTISNNNIQTMNEGVFSGFDISGQIRISGNPWKCNCSLEWMRYFYMKNKESYFDNGTELFLCQEDGVLKNYTEVDFCPTASSSISTSTEVTTPTTIATSDYTINNATTIDIVTTMISTPTAIVNIDSTPIFISSTPANNKNISCGIFKDKLASTWKRHHFSETIRSDRSKVIYHFENEDKTPFYRVKIENALPNEVLLWINSQDHEKYGCISDIHDTLELNTLEYMQSYFLCLLTDGEVLSNPFDCTILVVPPEWGARTWIPNGLKYAVIGGTLAVILAVILLAIAIGVLIEKRPRLVRKYRKYMLNQNFLLEKTTPSLYSMSDGYLSPHMYERINHLTYSNRRCQYRELPPPPPTRSRKFGGNTRFSREFSGVRGREDVKISTSRSLRDCAWHRKHPLCSASRSMSIPGERICPVFEF